MGRRHGRIEGKRRKKEKRMGGKEGMRGENSEARGGRNSLKRVFTVQYCALQDNTCVIATYLKLGSAMCPM